MSKIITDIEGIGGQMKKKLTRLVLSIKMVTKFVNPANTLDPVVTH